MVEKADLNQIASKWQARWEEHNLFEPEVSDKKKFFCNFPYPYINAYPHIGHLYTLMRVDAFARYKRLQGFNVLFPQGWHITGSPIANAAKRIKEQEPKQIKIMKDMGFSDNHIKKFEEPEYWLEFFAPEFKKDYKRMGMSVDWRREFHTTSLNPHYDKFIEWQFRKLKEKGYVVKGEFPVVWDPKENCAVGDHDRVQGEGETPQEFLLVKHKLEDNRFIVTATLRADTILGITNLYIHPGEEYKEIRVNGECWIVGDTATKRFREQGKQFEEVGVVQGIDLVGEKTLECDNHQVLVLPATFVDPDFGTGIVHSVPSESADDLIALYDLQKNEGFLKKYKLKQEEIQAINPIPVLDTPGHSNVPAEEFLKKYGVKNQNDRVKLERIKKELYKLSNHTATLNENYKDFFKEDLYGLPVEKAKKKIQEILVREGWVDTYYQLTGKVVTRSLTEAIVKIVDDQWFIDYSNEEWKRKAHECLEQMTVYPEKARSQFKYTIDWLREWACTREEGLGTRLPWDKKWLIESLSDSTIYLAYYTIMPYIQELDIEEVNDELFDYVLLGKEKKPSVTHVDEMRESFKYWYPVDFRNSGKDLIQNHLTFFIFNHVAIFPKEHWPKGIAGNGWVTVDGQKMSKSLGNMISLRQVADEFGVDASRTTILYGGEGLDDPNWDSSFAKGLNNKIANIITLHQTLSQQKDDKEQELDKWLSSKLHRHIQEATEHMEKTNFRSAIQIILFDMTKNLRHYQNRCAGVNKKIVQEFVNAQTIMLSCFAPHAMEESWEQLGHEGFVSAAQWPSCDTNKIDLTVEIQEDKLFAIKEDVRTVLTLSGIDQPNNIKIFLADEWKYTLVEKLKEILCEESNPKIIIGRIMGDYMFKQQGAQVMRIVPVLIKDRSKIPKTLFTPEEERAQYESMVKELEETFNCKVVVEAAQKQGKGSQGMPGKPAIIVE